MAPSSLTDRRAAGRPSPSPEEPSAIATAASFLARYPTSTSISAGSKMYTTQISYLEIYNDVGYDLLDPRHGASALDDLPKVTIMEDPDQNIHLRNLSIHQSGNEEEALNLLFLGDTNRMIAETPMNQASTRSHCIFTIHVCSREPGSATLRRSKLHLVDLAGSERVAKTGMGGQLLTEAKYINLSLHYLEQVIIALSEKNRSHIPYRNSMMTSVLRDSLGGNCMTTMIATVSVDKRNVEESISTCRFAQRVALIKNEAQLNEELDPTLVIVRLKKEIQLLREELAMVTGEQRAEQLAEDEIQKMEGQVKAFLDDPDPDITLDLGPDMRKIHYCFSLLKAMVRSGQAGAAGHCRPPSVGTAEDSPAPGELKKLKDMLQQRDNEISILVSMLKKEKKRAQDFATQLAQVPTAHLQSQNTMSSSQATPELEAGRGQDSAQPYAPRRQRGPELSMGRKEAFAIFRRDHEDSVTIEDNKALLKQRFAEAKALGEQVNGTRSRVNELKQLLEQRRMQRAAQVVMGGHEAPEEPDPIEEKLCRQIEEEKKSYKTTFSRLKGLKTEIEHLQLLLERAKVKLQRDFSQWWAREEACLQEPEPESEDTAAGQSLGQHDQWGAPSSTALPPARSVTPTRSAATSHALGSRDPTPLSQLRVLGPPSDLSFIPLTGDQKTDDDIMAFVRARQNLLSRTGLSQK
ncbi:kinesin-like protein KIF6 isoform X4 [Paramormyrops kingsleyae]|uniref:kinesin-like protein KIF6 isoform X4 n=1 Tax=Paramormyrops kingsleyae TaxID=1676925 RepID=UPI000CD66F81|nr:kinesin-like protein KIF6 isoform X6 [Paramormyrops kingsleyae]